MAGGELPSSVENGRTLLARGASSLSHNWQSLAADTARLGHSSQHDPTSWRTRTATPLRRRPHVLQPRAAHSMSGRAPCMSCWAAAGFPRARARPRLPVHCSLLGACQGTRRPALCGSARPAVAHHPRPAGRPADEHAFQGGGNSAPAPTPSHPLQTCAGEESRKGSVIECDHLSGFVSTSSLAVCFQMLMPECCVSFNRRMPSRNPKMGEGHAWTSVSDFVAMVRCLAPRSPLGFMSAFTRARTAVLSRTLSRERRLWDGWPLFQDDVVSRRRLMTSDEARGTAETGHCLHPLVIHVFCISQCMFAFL